MSHAARPVSSAPTAAPVAINPRVRPWWREPMMWLVIGGPATVVVAGIVTAVIAYRGADPVIERRSEPAAMKARNHAATGAVPERARAADDAPTVPAAKPGLAAPNGADKK